MSLLKALALAGAALPALAAQVSGPAFEVASIKLNKSSDLRSMMVPQPGGRFTATNVTLRRLILNAYQLPTPQLAGGPDWMNSDRFDVLAKASDDVPQEHVLLMLQALLAERFKLQAHSETRELPVYALVMARSDGRLGPQMRRGAVDCAGIPTAQRIGPTLGPRDPNAPCGYFGPGPEGGAKFRGVTVEAFAKFLEPLARRIVIDRTGLTGYFDVDLPMTTELGPPPPPPGLPDGFDRQSPSVTSIFTAIQEQLGLKLESTRRPVDVLVIDRAERPTED